jgi:UDP-2,3-diacylglucosamine hydrolase
MLEDPHVALIAGNRIVLAHGDAQCTDDHAYMAFRAQVREPGWQRTFLALPLEERRKIVEGARMGSKEAQRSKSAEIMDVNEMAIASLFDATGAELMIHGHTHRPARHEYRSEDGVRLRYVLPDWDCDAEPPRGGWIAIDAQGMVRRFGVDGVEVG